MKRKTSRAIIIEDNKILVMFRRKKDENNNLIEYYATPGGGIEKGETKEETVIRELKEEMNIDIEIADYLGVKETDKTVEYFYSAKILSGVPKLGGEEKERLSEINYYEPMWINIDELNNSNFNSFKFLSKIINNK